MNHIKELKPLKANPRKHNPRNIGMIVDSLQEVGAARSIVIDENNEILAGNGTIEAAGEAGITKLHVVDADGETIVAVRRTGLTDIQKARLAVIDNRANETSEWDAAILAQLAEDGVELDDLFSEDELTALIGEQQQEPGAGGDEFDTTPDETQTRVIYGDLWKLGEHRLLCGDSTKAEDVERLMDGEKAELCLTDPPYGIDLIKGDRGKVGGGTKKHPTRIFDAVQGDNIQFDPRPLLELAGKHIIWGGNYYAHLLAPSRCWFIWNKNHATDRTFAGCELAWTSLERHSKVYGVTWDGYTKEGESGSKQHPTQKPVKLFVDILDDIEGTGIVLDVYMGSGTTLIAAERTNRKCYGIEISPNYCNVILSRWEAETGKQAELAERL